MPALQRGSVRTLPSGKVQLRFYTADGKRHAGGTFATRTEAWRFYRDVIVPRGGRPRRRIDPPQGRAEVLTFGELVEIYLERHSALRSASTIRTLRHRLARPLAVYGDVLLSELEGMGGDLADFRATLPERFAHDVMRAVRQTFAAAVRYGYMTTNPAKDAGDNPSPKPRPIRTFTLAELDALEVELGPEYGPLVPLAAATGPRPHEVALLERRDVDRGRRLLTIRGAKTSGSWREIPLSRRALAALDRMPARFGLLFPSPRGDALNLNNFRRRVWAPAVEASGISTPARLYDLRSTFASNALAAGVTVFELARCMGTSVSMVEQHYGALLGGAHAGIAGRLDAHEAQLEQREAQS
jgi:integrase